MTTTRPSHAKHRLAYLILLLIGLGLFCSCQSQRQLCPAYDQHHRRETLPY